MSLTYGFYNSQSGDRMYSTNQISDFLDGLIKDGIFAPISDGNHHGFQVVETAIPSMAINVSLGKAWFNGTWTKIDAPYQVEIPAASALLSRIDAIVLTINKTRSSRSNYIEVISGEGSSSNPSKPNIQNESNIYRYVLAYVTVNAGVTSITQANIEDKIGAADGIPFVDLADPLGDGYPTTDQLLSQYKTQFDEWFDYMKNQLTTDAAGNLQTEIDTRDDNLANEYDENAEYSEGDFSMNAGVLKKLESNIWTPRKICDEIIDMKAAFQAGVDAVYNAVVAEGVTPASSTPEGIATAIATIRNGGTAEASQILSGVTAYSGKVLRSGSMPNQGKKTYTINPGGQQTIPAGYHDGTGFVKANPNQNSGTYTYGSGSTGGTVDMGANNTYRYVNAGNVYSKGHSDGVNAGHADSTVLTVILDISGSNKIHMMVGTDRWMSTMYGEVTVLDGSYFGMRVYYDRIAF